MFPGRTLNHAGDGRGLEPTTANTAVLTGHRPEAQSLLRGWIGYYGRYAPSALSPLLQYVNQTLVAWAQRKFKRFKRGATLAGQFIERLATERPDLFAHWRRGMTGTFV